MRQRESQVPEDYGDDFVRWAESLPGWSERLAAFKLDLVTLFDVNMEDPKNKDLTNIFDAIVLNFLEDLNAPTTSPMNKTAHSHAEMELLELKKLVSLLKDDRLRQEAFHKQYAEEAAFLREKIRRRDQMLATQRSDHLREVLAAKEQHVKLQLQIEQRDASGNDSSRGKGESGSRGPGDDRKQVLKMTQELLHLRSEKDAAQKELFQARAHVEELEIALESSEADDLKAEVAELQATVETLTTKLAAAEASVTNRDKPKSARRLKEEAAEDALADDERDSVHRSLPRSTDAPDASLKVSESARDIRPSADASIRCVDPAAGPAQKKAQPEQIQDRLTRAVGGHAERGEGEGSGETSGRGAPPRSGRSGAHTDIRSGDGSLQKAPANKMVSVSDDHPVPEAQREVHMENKLLGEPPSRHQRRGSIEGGAGGRRASFAGSDGGHPMTGPRSRRGSIEHSYTTGHSSGSEKHRKLKSASGPEFDITAFREHHAREIARLEEEFEKKLREKEADIDLMIETSRRLQSLVATEIVERERAFWEPQVKHLLSELRSAQSTARSIMDNFAASIDGLLVSIEEKYLFPPAALEGSEAIDASRNVVERLKEDAIELRSEASAREALYLQHKKANDKAQNQLTVQVLKLRSELNEAILDRDKAEVAKARLEFVINQLEGNDERFIKSEPAPKADILDRYKIEILQQHASSLPQPFVTVPSLPQEQRPPSPSTYFAVALRSDKGTADSPSASEMTLEQARSRKSDAKTGSLLPDIADISHVKEKLTTIAMVLDVELDDHLPQKAYKRGSPRQRPTDGKDDVRQANTRLRKENMQLNLQLKQALTMAGAGHEKHDSPDSRYGQTGRAGTSLHAKPQRTPSGSGTSPVISPSTARRTPLLLDQASHTRLPSGLHRTPFSASPAPASSLRRSSETNKDQFLGEMGNSPMQGVAMPSSRRVQVNVFNIGDSLGSPRTNIAGDYVPTPNSKQRSSSARVPFTPTHQAQVALISIKSRNLEAATIADEGVFGMASPASRGGSFETPRGDFRIEVSKTQPQPPPRAGEDDAYQGRSPETSRMGMVRQAGVGKARFQSPRAVKIRPTPTGIDVDV